MTNNNLKMTWDTYAYIRSLLESDKTRLFNEYLITRNHIGTKNEFESSREKAYSYYLSKKHDIDEMMQQLTYAAGMSAGPNASKEMKKFWGLPTK